MLRSFSNRAFSAYTLRDRTFRCRLRWLHQGIWILFRIELILMASMLGGIGDPLQTYRNQLEMEARGIRPLPCFHAGRLGYLGYYIQDYGYITLGSTWSDSALQLIDNQSDLGSVTLSVAWPSGSKYMASALPLCQSWKHIHGTPWTHLLGCRLPRSELSLHHNGERSTSQRRVRNATMPVNTFLRC